MSRQPPDGSDRPRRRIVGPQSALTDFLASRNISARQIELDFLARRREAEIREAADAEQAQGGQNGTGTPAPGGNGGIPVGAEGTANENASPTGGRTLSAEQMTVVQQIKQKKKGAKGKKKRGRNAQDSEDDEDELLLSALSNAKSARSLGQIENCAQCGKRFTVTSYSRADAAGGLLCAACSKKLAEADDAARKNKKPRAAAARGGGGGPVGQRRKAQSRILDGASPVGAKPLVTLCVEHLARNIHLAEDLGDLPEDVVDRIARMLSKRRLLNATTIDLLVRPEATEICVYDGAELTSGDYLRILQEMPQLRRLVVHNGIQFKDEVMQYLQTRDARLEALCLYGANLISDETWKAYLVERGRWLQTLQICQTDKHVTDEVMGFVQECAPGLRRLKINGNQALTAAGVDHIGRLEQLQHLGLDLARPVHADVYVRLLVRLGGGLQTLSVRRATEADNTVLMALHEYCRGLRKLRLTDNSRFTDDGFVRLFEEWENVPLQYVDFERCRDDDPDHPHDNESKVGLCSAGFQALMAHSGLELQHLNICACRHIDQAAFEAVFAEDKVYPELRHIEASFCEEITDRVVVSMFRSCPNLKEVATFGCMRVTGVGVPHGRIVVGVPNALGMQTVGQDE